MLILFLGGMVFFCAERPVFGQDHLPPPPASFVSAATPAPTPDLTTRVADLEAYVLNSPRASDRSGYQGPPSILSNTPGPGHNAWLLMSSLLVLFMTLPGLALFYGGLVRKKNVLSVLAQCLGIVGLVTLLWWSIGYSLVFGKGFSVSHPFIGQFLGGTEFAFLRNVTSAPNTDYSYWVSQNVFCMFQLMFAIITPALIIGAIAERMKYGTIMAFVILWMFVVYFPVAHMVWGATGYMNGIANPAAKVAAIDFAGGTVVHMTSGWTALILAYLLGPRLGFGREKMAPHSMVLCMIGTSVLWVGWYGFNAGSAYGADIIASNTFLTTTLAAAVASFSWACIETFLKRKTSVLGYCSGAVAGLVAITPACGFVSSTGAVILGVLAGVIPFLAVEKLKSWLGIDDALDTFGIHAVGGTLGMFFTGVLADPNVNANLSKSAVGTPPNAATTNGLGDAILHHTLWLTQLEALGITVLVAVIASFLIGWILKVVMGLRCAPEIERAGLDIAEHGEEGYIL
ncbi:MAG: ammonia channel protein [Verrucomicrobia bacterium]|nr:MAG: ammonia channel protein [Verrucomicrobiota bacterium]